MSYECTGSGGDALKEQSGTEKKSTEAINGCDNSVENDQNSRIPTTYGEYKEQLKRKYVETHPTKGNEKIVDGKHDFLGRDPSYPDDLNALMHPSSCDLCNTKMNSITGAKAHYESKAHDKKITLWIAKNYTDKGLTAPEIKRYFKVGPAGPGALYCDKCDLKLTSLTHANQHYAGKRHRLVLSQSAKPSGAGFYNNEGKWVRQSSKTFPQSANRRFGIGEQFQSHDTVTGNDEGATDATNKSPTTTSEKHNEIKPPKIRKVDKSDPNMFCAVCEVRVTSALQMTMHLSGVKHQKKLKASGIEISNATPAPSSTTDLNPSDSTSGTKDNVLYTIMKDQNTESNSDLSKYLTSNGKYYCQTCNISITNLPAMEKHLKGKRHLKSQIEEKAMAALAGRAPTKCANESEKKKEA